MKQQNPKFLRYLLPSISVLLWMITFVGVLVNGPKMINGDGDLGRHITVGNYILSNHVIPLTDVFSHTMTGEPLTPHEWLSEVLFALAHRIMGLDGAILLAAVVIATSFWLTFRRSSRGRKSYFVLIITTLLILLTSSIHWLSRPHIFTFLMLALWLMVLEDLVEGKTGRWVWLPVIMLFWVNLHGAFIAGFATWALYAAGLVWDRVLFKTSEDTPLPAGFWRAFLLGGGISLLVTLINPAGTGIWSTSVGYVANRFLVDHTVEYMAPDFHNPDLIPFLIFIAVLILSLGLKRKKVRAEWLIPSTAWLIMALYSQRNIPLFVIVAAPLLAESLEEIFFAYAEKSKFISACLQRDRNLFTLNTSLQGGVLLVLVVFLSIIGLRAGMKFDQKQLGNTYDPEKFPVAAVDWLETHPQDGEMFNYFIWGGYLLYREWPDLQVFIDGQTDFYGETLSREYLSVLALDPEWEEILTRRHVDWVILPVEELAARTLIQSPDWTVVYKDSTTVIVHRD
ncbi:MAG: hypothetical protein ABFC97_05065 [Anaerolineaceae bacterium]